MKARDGIEAQRGLNDVWPGDDYPDPPTTPDSQPLSRTQIAIVEKDWSVRMVSKRGFKRLVETARAAVADDALLNPRLWRDVATAETARADDLAQRLAEAERALNYWHDRADARELGGKYAEYWRDRLNVLEERTKSAEVMREAAAKVSDDIGEQFAESAHWIVPKVAKDISAIIRSIPLPSETARSEEG